MKKPTKRLLVGLILLLAVSWYSVLAYQDETKNQTLSIQTVSAKTIDVQQIHSYVNGLRTNHGLPVFSYSSALQNAANAKCSDMIAKNYYSHTSPSGETVAQFLAPYIPNDTTVWTGENLDDNVATAYQAYNDWLNSPGHYANMVSTHYTEEGVGTCKEPNGYNYVVEDFAQSPGVSGAGQPQTQSNPAAQVASNTSTNCSTLVAQVEANNELQVSGLDPNASNYRSESNHIWSDGAAYLSSQGCSP